MSGQSSRASSDLLDQPVDVRRYADALRRGLPLIGLLAAIVTLLVLVISTALPKTYTATARLVYNPASSTLVQTDAESTQRQLATYQAFVRAPDVIARAAAKLRESPPTLKESISAKDESTANILAIGAEANSPGLAANRANAVANAFLTVQEASQQHSYAGIKAELEAEIARLRSTPASAAKIEALESRIGALQIGLTGTRAQLQIAEAATPPGSPSSPKIAVNGVIAFVVSALLAILFVLARDQLRPRYASPKELGDALDVPVLAGVPYRPAITTTRRALARRGLEREAFDLLQTAIRLLGLPPSGQRSLIVTSAVHAEGKTTVTANLGRSLARTGQKTLLVSGDLRSPTLDGQFSLPSGPGLAECLMTAHKGVRGLATAVRRAIVSVPDELNLDVMVPGQVPSDPAALLSGGALDAVFEAIRERDYTYVIVDCPPMLGIADAQLLAKQVDDTLIVGRLDRVSPYQVEELRELLGRLSLRPVGLAVVGARVELSPYYVNERLPVTQT